MDQLPPILLSSYRDTQKRALLIGRTLVILMMGCLADAIVQAGERAFMDWHGGYLVVIALVIAIEAMLAREQTEALETHQRLLFHLSEWVAIAILFKLFFYMLHGPAQLLHDLAAWQSDFLQSFFTGEYLLALVLMAIVWSCARAYSGELKSLYRSKDDAGWEDLGKLQNILHQIRDNLAARIFLVGTFVVGLAVISRLPSIPILKPAALSGFSNLSSLLIVLIYFVLALLLLSQTQFALLQTRWLWQRLPVSPKISGYWVKYGLAFFFVLAVMAFLLPHQYTLGIFDTLRLVFGFLSQAFSLLFVLVALPFTFCMSLFSFLAPQATAPLPPTIQAIPPPAVPAAPVAWLEFARSLAFWVIFLGAIFLAIRYYLMQNAALWESIARFPLLRWAADAWHAIRNWFIGANRQIIAVARQQITRLLTPRLTTANLSARRRFNLGRLDPRARIIYFYLSLLETASQHGLPRAPAQTPSQYKQRLDAAAPEIEAELRDLTDAFIEARYSQHPVSASLSDRVSSQLERVKAALTVRKSKK